MVLPALEFDDTSLVLLLIILILGGYIKYFSKPSPLVHPLLLGKQSEVSKTRNSGESGVYRSWATGHHGAPLTTRPAGPIKTVADLFSTECAERSVLGGKISNKNLRKMAATFLRGLESLRDPSQSDGTSKLLMILPPVFQIPIIHLATALSTELDLIISSSSESNEAFSEQPRFVIVDEMNVESVINKLLANGSSRSTRPLVIVVESEKTNIPAMKDLAGQVREDIDVVLWMDVIVTGIEMEEKAMLEGRKLREWIAPISSDVHTICYVHQSDGSQDLKLTLTHESITSGIAGILSTFPADKRPTAPLKDTIASDVDVNKPFGMSLLFTAIYAGAALVTVGSSLSMEDKAEATLLYIHPATFHNLVDHLYNASKSVFPPLLSWAWKNKQNDISNGYVARSGLFENLVWKRLRASMRQGKDLVWSVRAVCVVHERGHQAHVGDIATDTDRARIMLSVPISQNLTSVNSTGPVFSTHLLDLRTTLVANHSISHVGPPASNVEVKLKGDVPEKGDPSGMLYARGPGILREEGNSLPDGWVDMKVEALVQPDGTFALTTW